MLQKFLTPEAPRKLVEKCEFCAADVPEEHSHVVHLEKRGVMCACRACWLLFTSDGAAGGKVRAIPDTVVRLQGPPMTEAQWDSLQIPVGTVFFFHNSVENRTVAFYPSPAGATESHLPLEAWQEIIAGQPVLKTMLPDVQALLVNQSTEGYIVPIDACYELVGIMRQGWRGFHGGDAVHQAIATFFDRIRARVR
jgi:hypothetical protein